MKKRAFYNSEPIEGSIRITQISGDKPIYSMVIVHEINGLLFKDDGYTNMEKAISDSTKYGCVNNNWKIEV